MLSTLVSWLVNTIGQLGYTGIVCLMFLESSFFPFPSEVVIPPAGYLASKGQMNIFLVIIAGILGSLLGALFNYWVSLKVGRPFFNRYGKYFLVSTRTLDKAEEYFQKHGHISTLIGRLLAWHKAVYITTSRCCPNEHYSIYHFHSLGFRDLGPDPGSSGLHPRFQ